MTKPTLAALSAAAALLVSAVVFLRGGGTPAVSTAGHIALSRPGFTPVVGTTKCVACHRKVSRRWLVQGISMDLAGLPVQAHYYVATRVCGNGSPGTEDAEMDRVDDTCEVIDWQTGWEQVDLCVAGSACDTFSRCACGPGCTWTEPGHAAVFPGPLNKTFADGTWAATVPATCIRKPCVELAGFSSMVAACQ